MVLMTDGQNGRGNSHVALIPTANQYGITFHCIGYSDAADERLAKIANETGGTSYFSKSDFSAMALSQAFSATADPTGLSSARTAGFVTVGSGFLQFRDLKTGHWLEQRWHKSTYCRFESCR